MKNTLKTTLKLVFILSLFFFIGCEKDLYEEAINDTSKDKMRYVTIDEVPFLKSTLEEYNPKYSYLSNPNVNISNKDEDDLNLDLEHIIEYLAANGLKSYSIPIKNEFEGEQQDYYFENLHILQIDGDYKTFIAKYNQTDDTEKFETPTFTGKIEFFDINFTPVDSVAFFNGQKIANPAPPTPDEEEPTGGGGWLIDLINWLIGSPSWNGIRDVPTSGGSSDSDGGSGGVFIVINGGNIVVGEPTTPPIENPFGGNIVIVPNQTSWPEFMTNLHIRANLICQRLGIEDLATRAWLGNIAYSQTSSQIYDYLLENNLESNYYLANTFVNYLIPQMIANPTIKFNIHASSKSPANIDLSNVTYDPFNNPNDPQKELKIKFRCIYDKLIESPTFKKLFIEIFQQNSRPNVVFKIEDLLGSASGGTVGETNPINNNGFNNEIKIDTQLIANGNAMSIIKTIMHECIHAYLNIKLADSSIGIPIPTLSNMELPECIDSYYNSFGIPQAQHNFMFNYLTNTMQTILNEIKDLLITPQQNSEIQSLSLHINQNTVPITNVSTPWNWNDYFNNLTLDGLQNCSAFASSIATTVDGITATNIVDEHRWSSFIQYKNVAYSHIPIACN